ncbi:MAG: RsmB/NOP family class I SAM-dependent RNA methyltransferase [Burkholderiaceae bacterium]
MRSNSLLDLSSELLREVLKFDQPADVLVSNFFRGHRALGPRERHALAETMYDVIRRLPSYRHLAQSGFGALERRLALLGWQGDAGVLRAASSPSEQQWLGQIAAIERSSLPQHLQHNLPAWLAQSLQSQLGDQFWPLVQACQGVAPLDLRVNVFKTKREAAAARLGEQGIAAEPTPYSPLGLRIQGKPQLQKLDVFRCGDVEVQDEGSQLLALMLDARRGEMVVDFCAGAGGKTLALGAAMRNTGRLYAFDVSGHRLAALKPRLARSGLSNIYPLQIAHERDERIKRLAGKIDRVLVDAPCSGLGTLRRNPDMKWRQSPESVRALQAQQTLILNGASRLLKPGGRLVYATCSLLDDENQAVANQFSAAHSREFAELPVADVLAGARVAMAQSLVEGKFLRLWPHRHNTDGFFAAAWTRN